FVSISAHGVLTGITSPLYGSTKTAGSVISDASITPYLSLNPATLFQAPTSISFIPILSVVLLFASLLLIGDNLLVIPAPKSFISPLTFLVETKGSILVA